MTGFWPRSAESFRLYRRLGFAGEGHLRQHEFFAGNYHDVVLPGITAAEHVARAPPSLWLPPDVAHDSRGWGKWACMPEGDPRPETQAQRDDRNLMELLQELRVAGLGVQVLFGFLLSLPFTMKFDKLSSGQRQLYVASLILAAVSTALLMAPVAYHRLLFRQRQKERLVVAANVMAICGLATVGLAITASVLLVTGYVDSGLPSILITVLIVCLFAGLWFALPLRHRKHT